MEQEIHGLVVTIKRITKEELKVMTNDYLHIDFNAFTRNEYNGLRLKYAFGGKDESVYLKMGESDDCGNYYCSTINLHGSFFDNSPTFDLEDFLGFIDNFGYTPKQLDVAFTDDKQLLLISEIKRWCGEDWKLYTTGSIFRKPPEYVESEGRFSRIHLGKSSSKANYGTVYVRPDTGLIRIEIKFKSEGKIRYLLDSYSKKYIHGFEYKALEALVGCIDFVTPASKKKRSPDKYVRQQSWKNFLESDVKKINWNEKNKEALSNRIKSDGIAFERDIKRLAAMIQSRIRKYEPMMDRGDIVRRIDEKTGNMLSESLIGVVEELLS